MDDDNDQESPIEDNYYTFLNVAKNVSDHGKLIFRANLHVHSGQE